MLQRSQSLKTKKNRVRSRRPRIVEAPPIEEVALVREINARRREPSVFMSYSIPSKSLRQKESLRHKSVVRHYGDHTAQLPSYARAS